jgi:chemotaxis protein histidine kinase CheA
LPQKTLLDQLPQQVTQDGRHFQIVYIPIEPDQKLERLLLVVSDITERVERARKDTEQQEMGTVFRHVLRDRPGFLEFFAESQRLVDTAIGESDSAVVKRALHTLKGNASMFGIVTVAAIAGTLESHVFEGQGLLDEVSKTQLLNVWSAFTERVRGLTDTSPVRVELTRNDLQSLRNAVSGGATSAEVLRFLRDVEREPAERRLTRISEQAKLLAKRLGKGDIVVTTESNNVRLDAERWAPFWGAFVHMIRNAIDHGLEDAAQRSAAGKPSTGQIWISTKQTGDQVIVEIRDDGRGVDWDALRSKAIKIGLSAGSEEQLTQLLYRGGLSTKSVVTEYSGRGTGVSACYNVCSEMGGVLTLSTVKGQGTTFRFAVPTDDSVTQATAA